MRFLSNTVCLIALLGAEIVRRWDGNPIGGRLVVELARKPCVFGPARVAGSLS